MKRTGWTKGLTLFSFVISMRGIHSLSRIGGRWDAHLQLQRRKYLILVTSIRSRPLEDGEMSTASCTETCITSIPFTCNRSRPLEDREVPTSSCSSTSKAIPSPLDWYLQQIGIVADVEFLETLKMDLSQLQSTESSASYTFHKDCEWAPSQPL